MKKYLLVAPLLIGGVYLQANLGDVLHKATETVKEGVSAAGDISRAAIGEAKETYTRVVEGSVVFTNTSEEPIFLSIPTEGRTDKKESYTLVQPGESINFSPDLSKGSEIVVAKNADEEYRTSLPEAQRVRVIFDGNDFTVKKLL